MRQTCRDVVAAAGRGEVALHMSVEGGQEFLFHRMRKGSREEAVAAFDVLDRLVTWHAFEVEVLHAAVLLARAGVRGRDAVHAATAQRAGFGGIVSPDRDFDAVPGLRRLDPAGVAVD
ncbi:MAG: type II toxin-antitoxin system VapC family toxin [Nocardioidaceae bacterium]|nr:type II toxin-antitoxin system VapC family toxin [Nocardioidaceae bacterium]